MNSDGELDELEDGVGLGDGELNEFEDFTGPDGDGLADFGIGVADVEVIRA